MRKDNKYNRQTWNRKMRVSAHTHPQSVKEIRNEISGIPNFVCSSDIWEAYIEDMIIIGGLHND